MNLCRLVSLLSVVLPYVTAQYSRRHCVGNRYCRDDSSYCERSDVCVCKSGYSNRNGYWSGNKYIYYCRVRICNSNVHCHDASSQCSPITAWPYQKCVCRSGYSDVQQTAGVYHYCPDINECNRNHGCDKDSTSCVNTKGSYRCDCKTGFVPLSTDGKVKCSVRICNSNVHCHDASSQCSPITAWPYQKCVCRSGYSDVQRAAGVYHYCPDINECNRNHGCDKDSTSCVNTKGSYRCDCKTGFVPLSTDGKVKCSGKSCNVNVACHTDTSTCIYGSTSPWCACKSGYSNIRWAEEGYYYCPGFKCGNSYCYDTNVECSIGSNCECTDSSTSPALIDGYYSCSDEYLQLKELVDGTSCGQSVNICNTSSTTCVTTGREYRCDCIPGFHRPDKNGWETCSDVNECVLQSCHDNATCNNTPGNYTCTCNTGFAGDGKNCTDVDECSKTPVPCHENATCANILGSYNCSCVQGYQGNGTNCSVKTMADGAQQTDDNEPPYTYIGIGAGGGLLLLIAAVIIAIVITRRRKRDREQKENNGEIGTEMYVNHIPVYANDGFHDHQYADLPASPGATTGGTPMYESMDANADPIVHRKNPERTKKPSGMTDVAPGNPKLNGTKPAPNPKHSGTKPAPSPKHSGTKPVPKPKPKINVTKSAVLGELYSNNMIPKKKDRSASVNEDEQTGTGGLNVVEYSVLESESQDVYNRLHVDEPHTTPPVSSQTIPLDTVDGEVKLSGQAADDAEYDHLQRAQLSLEPQPQYDDDVYNNLYGATVQDADSAPAGNLVPGSATPDTAVPPFDASSYEPEDTYFMGNFS